MKSYGPIFGRWRVLAVGVLIAALSAGIGGLWVRERSRVAGWSRLARPWATGDWACPRAARSTGRALGTDGEVLLLLGECDWRRESAKRPWPPGRRVDRSSPFFGRPHCCEQLT